LGGFRAYAGMDKTWMPPFLLAALAAAGASYFAWIAPNSLARQGWLALLAIASCGWTALWLWQLPKTPAQVAVRVTSLGYALIALVLLAWLVWPVFGRQTMDGLTLLSLVLICSQLVTLTGQMLMLTQRHAGQLALAAMTDSLTGIHNRAGFEELATRKIARAAQTQKPLALLVFDIDHFKRINDTHGHPVGDRVLRRVVGRAVNTLRPDDLLGRWGGEEFVALLTDVTEEQAVQAAERLRLAISKRGFKLSDGTRLQVSVSIGLMAMQAADYDPRTQLRKLVAVADVALYEAKRGGRDQVRVGEPQTRPMPLGDALVSPWVSGVGARSTH